GRRRIGAGVLGGPEAPRPRDEPQRRRERRDEERDAPADGQRREAGRAPEAVDRLDERHGPPRRPGQRERERGVVGAREQPVLQRRGVGEQQRATARDGGDGQEPQTVGERDDPAARRDEAAVAG